MADMGEYMADKYTVMVKAIAADLGRAADNLAFAQNILRALKNPDAGGRCASHPGAIASDGERRHPHPATAP